MDNTKGNVILVRVHIPTLGGYSTKKFDLSSTVRETIKSLNSTLPEHLRSERYRLFCNGMRMLDEDRSINSYGVKEMDVLELKRGMEYEFEHKTADSINRVYLEGEDITCEQAAKKLSRFLCNDSQLVDHDFKIFKMSDTGSLSPLDDNVKFASYKLKPQDDISFMIRKKGSNDNHFTKMTMIYSPFQSLEDQRVMFLKKGYLKKQGGSDGGRRNWRKRYFVCSERTIAYFKDEKAYETNQKALGILFWDDFIEVSAGVPSSEDPKKLKKERPDALFFCLKTSDRILWMYATNKKDLEDWILSIKSLGEIALALKAIEVDDVVQQRKIENQNMMISIGRKVKAKDSQQIQGISLPYNLQHKAHVNFDFKWAGDDPEELFEMQELLGKGAWGKVLKANHKASGFTLAIKIILNTNKTMQESIQKEVEVLKKCRSRAVVAYYGTCLKNNETWILMDYCAMGSLKDMMKTCMETLNERQISYTVQQTLKGLAYLHNSNILHLDVKAANILATQHGEVKLADFGVSEQLQSGMKESTDYVGSPLFMAPEVIKKSGYNSKADIWSLGITMIEMADGRPPNTDLKSMADLNKIIERPSATVLTPEKYSSEFNDFIAKCLTKDPELRPSAMELLAHPFVCKSEGPGVFKDLIEECNALRKTN